jgi:hypothetical protein
MYDANSFYTYSDRILIPKVISLRHLSSTNMVISCNYNRLSSWGDFRPPFTISSSVIFRLLARAPEIDFRHPWKEIVKKEWKIWNSQKFNMKAKVQLDVWDSDPFILKKNRWPIAAYRIQQWTWVTPRRPDYCSLCHAIKWSLHSPAQNVYTTLSKGHIYKSVSLAPE